MKYSARVIVVMYSAAILVVFLSASTTLGGGVPDTGRPAVTGGLYTNSEFALSLRLPAGWHAMHDDLAKLADQGLVPGEEWTTTLLLAGHQVSRLTRIQKRGQPPRATDPCITIDAVTPAHLIAGEDAALYQKDILATFDDSELRILTGPRIVRLAGKVFSRIDAETSVGGRKAYRTYLDRVAGDKILSIQLDADTEEGLAELERLLSRLVLE